MPPALWVNNGNSRPLSPGLQDDYPFGTGFSSSGGNPAGAEIKVYESGVFSLIGWHINQNLTTFANLFLQFFKNGVGFPFGLTIAPGATGHFLDAANSVAVVANDVVRAHVTHGHPFDGGAEFGAISIIFTPDDPTHTISQAVAGTPSPDFINPGETRFFALHGHTSGGSTIESERQDCVPINCTMQNARVFLDETNTLNGPLVCTLRKNGIPTALSVTIGAGIEGWIEGNGATVAITAEDKVGWHFDATGASAGQAQLLTATVQFLSTSGEWFVGLGQQSRTPLGENIDLGLGGVNFHLDTQAEQQLSAPMAGRIIGLCINVRANTGLVDAHLRSRINGADGVSHVLIPAGQVGFFDGVGPDAFIVGDLLNLRLHLPVGTTGLLTYSTIDWAGSFVAPPEPEPEPEVGIPACPPPQPPPVAGPNACPAPNPGVI